MTRQTILRLFDSILVLLQDANEPAWIPAIEQRIATFTAVEPGTADYQDAIRDALNLFGGMGSFQDIVLQDQSGVLRQQQELGRLRHELFAAIREELQ